MEHRTFETWLEPTISTFELITVPIIIIFENIF